MFASDIALKSVDVIKVHQERHNVSSVFLIVHLIFSRIVVRLFSFNKVLLFIKKLAFDGFYPLIVVL